MPKSIEDFAAEAIPMVKNVNATLVSIPRLAVVSGTLFEQSNREDFVNGDSVRMFLTRQQVEHLLNRLKVILPDMT